MARNGKTEAKTNLPGKDECEGTVCFHTVLESEHKTINARRNGKRPAVKPRVPKPSKTDHGSKRDPIYDTIGVALSGGGIRSAAFCLGALQALEVAGALKQVDYLSTVSGGGYTGACWSSFAAHEAHEGLPFPSELKAEESPALRHIRDHSNYLIPRGAWDVLISTIIYLRGIAANVLVVLPWLLLAAALTITIYPTQDALKQADDAKFLPIAVWVALVLGVMLVIWAVIRSWQAGSEIPGFINTLLSWYAVGLGIVVFVELQPHLLNGLASIITRGFTTWLMTVGAGLAATVGLFGNKLAWIVAQLTKDATIWAKIKAASIKFAVFLAALALPVIVWLIYARLTILGISANSADYWIRNLYFWSGLLLLILSLFLMPNANSLHRLYRDRLSDAFLFKSKPQDDGSGAVAPLSEGLGLPGLRHNPSPYHLINAALNIQNSRHANQRGRDAEFFLFSANYVGSECTGYIKTEQIEKHAQPILDLGTAMAISGAAASSNMGANLRRWAITLALLNVRLGFWFPNPKSLKKHPWWRGFLTYSNFYLLSEMLSLLGENRPFLYLTDGGHIENLGLYQLLRRRCRLIIVIDAEADPKMAFNSFIKAERYARIDLGTRIELPWYEIRDATLETDDMIAKRGDTGSLISRAGPHCALGRIYYPEGEGILLYIKSSLTGDESDYVINYKNLLLALSARNDRRSVLQRGAVRGVSKSRLSCDAGLLLPT